MTVQGILAVVLMTVFTALAMTHVYWALGGRRGSAAAVPSDGGRPLFKPSRLGTLLVAAALLMAAAIVAGVLGWIATPVPMLVLRAMTLTISLVFFVRAVGDFRSVGFFKVRNDSSFASRDSTVYSPLCVAIAGAAFLVGWWGR
jgi:hypothetical protein